MNFFDTILCQPLFNALILFYKHISFGDFGIAVIILTLAIRSLFYPLMNRSLRAQKAMKELQPKVKEIQDKYKEDKQKQGEELMALYKREKFNPFAGFVPILVQLPVLIAIFKVFKSGLGSEQMAYLYSFVSAPSAINVNFLGLINLAEPISKPTGSMVPNMILLALIIIVQILQTKMTSLKTPKKSQKKGDSATTQVAAMMQKQMLYFFPFFTLLVLWNLPAIIALYWFVSNTFSYTQQYLIFKKSS